jgi:hypothetical protein
MGMRTSYGEGQILVFEVKESSGARIDKLICNVSDTKQGLKILRILQEKYGFMNGIEFSLPEQPKKGFLDI